MASRLILFSIVIPTYNRSQYIARTILSVLQQDYDFFELIIVDDGSTDDTEDIVASFHDKRISYYKKVNGERAAARNYGVRQAKGDYVTFLDSDDLIKPNHLTVAAKFLKQNINTDVFHIGYDVTEEDNSIVYRWRPLPDPVNHKLIEGNFLSCLGVFAKRQIFLQHPFNEDRDLSGSEDYELWIRLAARYTIRTCSESTACLVNHQARSVLQLSRSTFETRISLAKHYIKSDDQVQVFFGSRIKIIFAYLNLYAALHLALAGFKSTGLRTLIQAVKLHAHIVFNYRFWVALKKIVLIFPILETAVIQ